MASMSGEPLGATNGYRLRDLCAYGPDSVCFYTRRKTITQRWPSGGVSDKAQFAFPSNG